MEAEEGEGGMNTITELRQLGNHLSTFRFIYESEADLQMGIEQVLSPSAFRVEREVQLGDLGRLDFLINGRIVIETKIGGSAAELMRQVARYAQSEMVAGILVVTDRASHRLPPEFNGKPVLVHSLLGGAF
ncbi:MAG: hypothetical protein ACLGPM_07550 [Acidobacteriota bacterium]